MEEETNIELPCRLSIREMLTQDEICRVSGNSRVGKWYSSVMTSEQGHLVVDEVRRRFNGMVDAWLITIQTSISCFHRFDQGL